MIPLVTLAHARADRRIIDPADTTWDNDLASKILIATGIVMKHCKLTEIPDDWLSDDAPDSSYTPADFVPQVEVSVSPPVSPVTFQYVIVPGSIQAAILGVTTELFENREGGETATRIANILTMLLDGFRDPTLA